MADEGRWIMEDSDGCWLERDRRGKRSYRCCGCGTGRVRRDSRRRRIMLDVGWNVIVWGSVHTGWLLGGTWSSGVTFRSIFRSLWVVSLSVALKRKSKNKKTQKNKKKKRKKDEKKRKQHRAFDSFAACSLFDENSLRRFRIILSLPPCSPITSPAQNTNF